MFLQHSLLLLSPALLCIAFCYACLRLWHLPHLCLWRPAVLLLLLLLLLAAAAAGAQGAECDCCVQP
jgi:hypothetical protein